MAKKAKSVPAIGDNTKTLMREFQGSVVINRGGFYVQLGKYKALTKAGVKPDDMRDPFVIAHMAGYLANPTFDEGVIVASSIEEGADVVAKFAIEAAKIMGLKNKPPQGGTDEHRDAPQQRAYNAARSAWSYLKKTAEGTNKHQRAKGAKATKTNEPKPEAPATETTPLAPFTFTGKEAVPAIKSSTDWDSFYQGLAAIVGRTIDANAKVPQKAYFGLGQRILEMIAAAHAEMNPEHPAPRPRTKRN